MVKICVLGGAGHIGSGIVRHLVELGAEVVVADLNFDKANEIARSVGGEAVKVNAEDKESVVNAVRGCDSAVSAIGPFYKFGVAVLDAAISAGVNFVDVNDDYDATTAALELHDKAKESNALAVVGLGATPGLTNVLAKLASQKLDSVKSIGTYWAWTALDPTMGTAIVEHYLHASTGRVPSYRNGQMIEVQALSEPEIVEFPEPLGKIEVANVGHPEPVTIPRYLKVENVINKGTVWPKIMADATAIISKFGWTSLSEVEIGGARVTVRDVIVRLVEKIPEIAAPETITEVMQDVIQRFGSEFALHGVGIAVRVEGEKNGKEVVYKYGIADASAVRATALPAAVGAMMLAERKIDGKGVFAPEGIIEPEKFLKEVSNKLEVHEEKVVRRKLS